ncbi:MAG: polyprenyl diphosphate synthase, partial [Deltaproteobacteria bacterium]
GGREEILRALKNIVIADRTNKIDIDSLDEKVFSSYLYTANMPEPDLVIRTGSEKRISNFLLWQSAYAEYCFSDMFWPDFGETELLLAIKSFQSRERRFGMISEQVTDQRK